MSFGELAIEDVDDGGTPGKKIGVNDDSVTLADFTGTLNADDFVRLNESIDGARVTGTDGNDVIVAGFVSEGVVNAPDDASGTTNDSDSVTGEVATIPLPPPAGTTRLRGAPATRRSLATSAMTTSLATRAMTR